MANPPDTVEQNLVKLFIPTIEYRIYKDTELTPEAFDVFKLGQSLGLNAAYSASNGQLVCLAVASSDRAVIIEFFPGEMPPRPGRNSPTADEAIVGRAILQDAVFTRDAGQTFAFDYGPLAMALYTDLDLRVTNAMDVQSACPDAGRKHVDAAKALLGEGKVYENLLQRAVDKTTFDASLPTKRRCSDLVPLAWLAQFVATYENGATAFTEVKPIDTAKLSSQYLDVIGKITNDSRRMEQNEPTQRKHSFKMDSGGRNADDPSVRVKAQKFGERFRSGQQMKMQVQTKTGGRYTTSASVDIAKGKGASLTSALAINEDQVIKTLVSIGKDDPTQAEKKRAATLLRILQGDLDIMSDNPWVQNIWLRPELVWPEEWSRDTSLPRARTGDNLDRLTHLNPSQRRAAKAMLSTSDQHRITIIQGPPGTGKTSVIAATVQQSITSGGGGIWLVAQSNVAVKNIAEKLEKVGFHDYRLLVSRDFYEEWHEHIYEAVKDNLICSDRFKFVSPPQMRGMKVILCTISMLSNSLMSKFTRYVPLQTLIVDEASQIEIGAYIPVFTTYTSLRKCCFIGDDKQLPPFGQDDLESLQSIFEVPHLRDNVVFLDTQYRMPPQLGDFISEAVYDGKLKSNPKHPITRDLVTIKIVDAEGSEQPAGDSFQNKAECKEIMKIAALLEKQKKNYKIITPYDGQRNLLEKTLQSEGLDWGGKVFNVDSFQGNEEDYIVVSLVRSGSLGFLNSLRRTNVMLTRCKLGMYVVSSFNFLVKMPSGKRGFGAVSLAGMLAVAVPEEAWLYPEDLDEGEI